MQKNIKIQNDSGVLESIYDVNSSTSAAVITHPHPLYGGNMENTVVHTIASVFKSIGFSTLRFNFRGVGASSGHYDDGIGEQEDLKHAMHFLKENGYDEVILAGYSFGSWVIYNFALENQVNNQIILISPPVDFVPFKKGGVLKNLTLIVSGDCDDFASRQKLEEEAKSWNPVVKLKLISGADHFYSGSFSQLSQSLQSHLQNE